MKQFHLMNTGTNWFNFLCPSTNLKFIRRETKWMISKKNNDPRVAPMLATVQKHLKHQYFQLHPELKSKAEKQEAWSDFYKACEQEVINQNSQLLNPGTFIMNGE